MAVILTLTPGEKCLRLLSSPVLRKCSANPYTRRTHLALPLELKTFNRHSLDSGNLQTQGPLEIPPQGLCPYQGSWGERHHTRMRCLGAEGLGACHCHPGAVNGKPPVTDLASQSKNIHQRLRMPLAVGLNRAQVSPAISLWAPSLPSCTPAPPRLQQFNRRPQCHQGTGA